MAMDCSGILRDLMHVVECSLAFQSPCCAVDAFVSMIRANEGRHGVSVKVLGELCSLMSRAVLEAARAPADFEPMRLLGIQAACQDLVAALNDVVFVYAWSLT
jgi:hypothetical protein